MLQGLFLIIDFHKIVIDAVSSALLLYMLQSQCVEFYISGINNITRFVIAFYNYDVNPI